MRSTFIGFLTIFLPLAITVTAWAQAAWHEFSPAQSRVLLIAPGLREQPNKAMELYNHSSIKGTRQYMYVWDAEGGKKSTALIRLGVVAGEMYSFPAFSDASIRETILSMTAHLEPTFPSGSFRVGDSPLGALRYQRVHFSKSPQSQCFVFGDVLGGVYFSTPSSGGILPGGDKYLVGLFCAPSGETLLNTDMTTVLSGLAFDDFKPSESVRRTASEHRYSR